MILCVLWSSLLISCALAPPDVFVCSEISMSKGYCIKTISDEEMFVDDEHLFNGKTWFDMRPVMLQIPVDSWVEIKSFIIKTCKKNQDCTANISSWERKIERIDEKITEKNQSLP